MKHRNSLSLGAERGIKLLIGAVAIISLASLSYVSYLIVRIGPSEEVTTELPETGECIYCDSDGYCGDSTCNMETHCCYPTCNPTTCPSGCCFNNTCYPGDAPGFCGVGGGSCTSCHFPLICSGGNCVPNDKCNSDADCLPGEICLPGGMGGNYCKCNGCYDAAFTQCYPGNTAQYCGAGGSVCLDCTPTCIGNKRPSYFSCQEHQCIVTTDLVCNKQACGASCDASNPCQAGYTCDLNSCTCVRQCTTEVCDGIDNDCDGVIDENCSCSSGQTRSCGSSIGACRPGVQTCTNGVWGTCQGGIGPSTESCNNVDDDCDGYVDNGVTRTCGETQPNAGVCKNGTQICANGEWGECQGEVKPNDEVCDGLDNNCDGTTDEGCAGCTEGEERECGNSEGECEKGTQTCENGSWSECQGNVTPTNETCDEKDNDCDGQVDEGNVCGQAPSEIATAKEQGVAKGVGIAILVCSALLGIAVIAGWILYLAGRSKRKDEIV